MRLPTWVLFVCILGGAVLCLASSRDDASDPRKRTSPPEPLECRLRRQEELITCRGVNTTQLVESLTRMREQVAEGRQLGEKPHEGEDDKNPAPARGGDGSPTVREVSYFSCLLPKVTAASLLTPSSLEIVSVISSGVEEVLPEAFNAHAHTLTRLDLSHNLLKTLPNALVNLTRLEVLDLRYNEIDHLPEGTKLFNLHRLRQLHLDHNKLGQVRGMQERLGYRSSGISLAVFNLEPLRDSLTHLTLGHNAISAFPEQFSRPFTRLTNLDISSNHISEVLEGGFSEMPRLQYLDLSGNLLHSFSLRGLEASLLDLNLRGNPWTCTCDSKWILKSLQSNASAATPTVTTPTCSTPLHLRHRDLTSLTELDLCPPEVASSDNRVVFVGDEGDGPLRKALDSLHLLNVTALNHKALIVSWRIDAEFYSPSSPPTEPLSWAVTLREMREDPRSATVTKMNLERYKEERPDWQPRDSLFTELLHGLEPETQYVLCLTPTQDHHLFIRPDKCRYVSTLGRTFHTTTTTTTAPAAEVPRIMPFVSTESYSAETERVSMEHESRRVILSWNVTIYPHERPDSPTKREAILLRPLGWRITFRRFGEENDTEVVLVSRGGEPVQNFTNHYSVEGLEPGTGYTFCFHSLTEQEVSESLAGSTSEVRDMIPQANFHVSQGRSLQIHADHQPAHADVRTGFAPSPAGDSKIPLGVTSDREVRTEGTNPGLAQHGGRPAVLPEGSGQTLPSQGSGRSFSPNVPPVPNFPSQGKNSGFPANIPTVPNFPSHPRRPPRPQAGGNFVYTSTGERIPLPSTSSGFGPFRMPSIVGPIVNIGSIDPPPSSSSTPGSPRNSKQRFIYEFDDSSSEKPPKQSFTYESTTEATNTTTPARQIYTYQTRRKRSVDENANTRYSKILQTGAVQYCQEIVTLDENDIITPVAIASTVSSSTTMVVVLIFCCCCPKRCRRKKSGWSGRPSYTTRKVSTISAPTPVNVFSGHSSIITGSVIGEGNGNLKSALPPRSTTSTTPGGTTYVGREANGNLVKTGRSVSVTSSAGYLTPMQMPNGVVHDPDQVFGDAQLRQRPDLSTLKDRLLQQHKDLKDFHPGYDIPPTSSNKTLFGYDYPHPSPVNPIGAHSNHTGRTDNLSTVAAVPSHSTRDPNHAASSINSGQDPETQQPEVNLNIPFAQNKSSGLNKSVDLNRNPALNRSVDYNYIAPEDIDSKPRTYIKNATAKNRHRKFGFPHRAGEEHLTLDAPSSPESQDYNDHPLSNGELSNSAPDLVNVGGSPTSPEEPQPSETEASARLNLLIGNQTTNSLPRLSREEHGGTTSLPPEQTPPHAPAEVNCYANLPVSQGGKRDEQEPRTNKTRDMYHTWTSPRINPKKTRPSMGEVVLTGGTLIEVPDGYVVPKPPKPARPVTLLTQGEEKVEDSENPPEILPALASQEDNKPVRRLPPLVIPNDSESEKSKITHLITPEMESNRIIISTGMPV